MLGAGGRMLGAGGRMLGVTSGGDAFAPRGGGGGGFWLG
jgi:hypothetical protein